MYRPAPRPLVSPRRAARALALGGSALALLAGAGSAAATGETNLQETSPLVWVLLAIGIGGALITFAILVYALWRFRDPRTRGRRYG